MIAGDLYRPDDVELAADRTRTRLLLKALNDARDDQPDVIAGILKELIPGAGAALTIQPPFFCDYGYNIWMGEKVFFNFNCVVLDVAPVRIGSRTMFGPNVQIYTATHPIDPVERASGVEFAKPITIGEDVWVGGSAVICPGVNIGDRSIIGAGSVVTKDIPAGVIAAGNPCKVIREI
ncbi:maltose O-acetyltransferase [Cnuella takakiae]|uniref:Maltose O-acetyltransferase n=2 Tax=Cnuella takakiae TaxID=1302690 RepID=A0A1M4WNV9_9BACT|nr:maltose O-acetyltransferase [Cnuella takakiae]